MAPTNYGEVLARNVRAARSRKGLNQQSLGTRMQALGFTAWLRQTVANVEKAKRRLTAEEVVGLAYALETSIGALIDPSPDDGAISLPSGELLSVWSVLRSVRHFNDGELYWVGDVPQIVPLTGDAHSDRIVGGDPVPEALSNVTPEMHRERNRRLIPIRDFRPLERRPDDDQPEGGDA